MKQSSTNGGLVARNTHFWLSRALAMCPKICAKVLGMIPLSCGDVFAPDMVYVLPVPVCPYANIVPLYPWRTLSTIGLAVSLYISTWVESVSKTASNEKTFGGSPCAAFWFSTVISLLIVSTRTMFLQCPSNSFPFKGRTRTTTLTFSISPSSVALSYIKNRYIIKQCENITLCKNLYHKRNEGTKYRKFIYTVFSSFEFPINYMNNIIIDNDTIWQTELSNKYLISPV